MESGSRPTDRHKRQLFLKRPSVKNNYNTKVNCTISVFRPVMVLTSPLNLTVADTLHNGSYNSCQFVLFVQQFVKSSLETQNFQNLPNHLI